MARKTVLDAVHLRFERRRDPPSESLAQQGFAAGSRRGAGDSRAAGQSRHAQQPGPGRA